MEDRNLTEEIDERAEEQARKAKEARKSVSRRMIIYMVITLSFFLSLVGTGTSGHFTVRSWIDSFIISTSVSMLMGFVIPVRYIVEKVCAKYNLQEGDLNTRLVESLITDLLFTPLMTYITLDLKVNPDVMAAYIQENGAGHKDDNGQVIFPFGGMDVFGDWVTSLELVDGDGTILFPGHHGQNGYGNEWAEFLYPYIETIPNALYLAPVKDGTADMTQAVQIK